MLLNKLNSWLKSSLRAVLTVFIVGLLFISVANPAQAKDTADGVTNLNEIQKETDDVARSNPRGIEEVTEKSQEGLNGVQGDENQSKMISKEEADATTVKEKAASFFDKLGN